MAIVLVQELGKIYFCLKVVSYVKLTQESENLFFIIIEVDLRHKILLQS